jgi:DNA-binding LacI/PurR family transcriptional regulator
VGQLCCDARMSGYTSAMAGAGLPVDPELTVEAALSREEGRAAVEIATSLTVRGSTASPHEQR